MWVTQEDVFTSQLGRIRFGRPSPAQPFVKPSRINTGQKGFSPRASQTAEFIDRNFSIFASAGEYLRTTCIRNATTSCASAISNKSEKIRITSMQRKPRLPADLGWCVRPPRIAEARGPCPKIPVLWYSRFRPATGSNGATESRSRPR